MLYIDITYIKDYIEFGMVTNNTPDKYAEMTMIDLCLSQPSTRPVLKGREGTISNKCTYYG